MDAEFISELFSRFRPVTTKRMFGGSGIYAEGLMFAIVFETTIYLRVDADSIADFEREGSRPFVYPCAKNHVGRESTSFWLLPERLYDDPEELAVWAARALAIAERRTHARTAMKAPAKRPTSKKSSKRR
jgi:DNA transformation protein and related proteins